MYNFKGKVALVTGAGRMRGFGHATAVRFAKEGADVVVSSQYRPPEKFPEEEKSKGWKGLDSVVEEIEAQGVRGLAITADVSNRKQVQDMVDKAVAEFRHIDFFVANAGIEAKCSILELTEEEWHRVLGVNLDGAFYSCQAVAKHMVERGGGGAIVIVASRAAKQGAPGFAHYCASKSGLHGLAQVLALELISHGIRVNSVLPGRFFTNMHRGNEVWKLAREKGIDLDEAANMLAGDVLHVTPLKRIGYPEELANVILFLCSNEASFMIGQELVVDGGRITDRLPRD